MSSIVDVLCDEEQRAQQRLVLVCDKKIQLRAADPEALELWLKMLRDATRASKLLRQSQSKTGLVIPSAGSTPARR